MEFAAGCAQEGDHGYCGLCLSVWLSVGLLEDREVEKIDKMKAAVMQGFEALDRGDVAKRSPDQIAEDVLRRYQNGEL